MEITALGDTVIALSSGGGHTCALKANRSLWCCQIGDGTQGTSQAPASADKVSPVEITALGTSVKAVSAGGEFTCAVKTDGSVWCWGDNHFGQLGQGTSGIAGNGSGSPVPIQVSAVGTTTESIGIGYAHACAIKTSGAVWCWGRNDGGQIGDGTGGTSSAHVSTPKSIATCR